MSLFVFFCFFFLFTFPVLACESCALSKLGQNQQQRFFVEYYLEQQRFDDMDASDAHQLHHQGHHVHNRTNTSIHHYVIGVKPTSKSLIQLDLPYTVGDSIEIHGHSRLGKADRSHGLADIRLTGQYDLYESNHYRAGLIGGVKLATGSTKELNAGGDIFEAELQPGTGSYDWISGGYMAAEKNRFKWRANTVYFAKTPGSAEYEFGDITSLAFDMDYALNPKSTIVARLGVNTYYQYELRHRQNGISIKDSGGQTLLMGPALKLIVGQGVEIFGVYQMPLWQDLGGVHQELLDAWHFGTRVSF